MIHKGPWGVLWAFGAFGNRALISLRGICDLIQPGSARPHPRANPELSSSRYPSSKECSKASSPCLSSSKACCGSKQSLLRVTQAARSLSAAEVGFRYLPTFLTKGSPTETTRKQAKGSGSVWGAERA